VAEPEDDAPMRLIGEPVVGRADAFAVDQGDTAEFPLAGLLFAPLRPTRFDRLVAPPESGLAGWSARFRSVLVRCGLPLLLIAALCAGPMYLIGVRVSDTVVAAPVLVDLAGGAGLLLLVVIWLAYVAFIALPVVLCLAGVAALVVNWAAEGVLPGFRTVLRATGHRLRALWPWLVGLGLVLQLPALMSADAETPVTVLLAVASAALTMWFGVLGMVVLFERHRGPRRALRLLSVCPPAPVFGLGVASVALAGLPLVADPSWGPLAETVIALVWAVAAVLTYAQARRAEGPLTSVQLQHELVA
jgi:hypothetical protein